MPASFGKLLGEVGKDVLLKTSPLRPARAECGPHTSTVLPVREVGRRHHHVAEKEVCGYSVQAPRIADVGRARRRIAKTLVVFFQDVERVSGGAASC